MARPSSFEYLDLLFKMEFKKNKDPNFPYQASIVNLDRHVLPLLTTIAHIHGLVFNQHHAKKRTPPEIHISKELFTIIGELKQKNADKELNRENPFSIENDPYMARFERVGLGGKRYLIFVLDDQQLVAPGTLAKYLTRDGILFHGVSNARIRFVWTERTDDAADYVDRKWEEAYEPLKSKQHKEQKKKVDEYVEHHKKRLIRLVKSRTLTAEALHQNESTNQAEGWKKYKEDDVTVYRIEIPVRSARPSETIRRYKDEFMRVYNQSEPKELESEIFTTTKEYMQVSEAVYQRYENNRSSQTLQKYPFSGGWGFDSENLPIFLFPYHERTRDALKHYLGKAPSRHFEVYKDPATGFLFIYKKAYDYLIKIGQSVSIDTNLQAIFSRYPHLLNILNPKSQLERYQHSLRNLTRAGHKTSPEEAEELAAVKNIAIMKAALELIAHQHSAGEERRQAITERKEEFYRGVYEEAEDNDTRLGFVTEVAKKITSQINRLLSLYPLEVLTVIMPSYLYNNPILSIRLEYSGAEKSFLLTYHQIDNTKEKTQRIHLRFNLIETNGKFSVNLRYETEQTSSSQLKKVLCGDYLTRGHQLAQLRKRTIVANHVLSYLLFLSRNTLLQEPHPPLQTMLEESKGWFDIEEVEDAPKKGPEKQEATQAISEIPLQASEHNGQELERRLEESKEKPEELETRLDEPKKEEQEKLEACLEEPEELKGLDAPTVEPAQLNASLKEVNNLEISERPILSKDVVEATVVSSEFSTQLEEEQKPRKRQRRGEGLLITSAIQEIAEKNYNLLEGALSYLPSLVVATSTIPNAGDGLFIKGPIRIPKNTIVALYDGEICFTDDLNKYAASNELDPTHCRAYCVSLGRAQSRAGRVVVGCAVRKDYTTLGPASYINHSGITNASIISIDDSVIAIVTTESIEVPDNMVLELMASYESNLAVHPELAALDPTNLKFKSVAKSINQLQDIKAIGGVPYAETQAYEEFRKRNNSNAGASETGFFSKEGKRNRFAEGDSNEECTKANEQAFLNNGPS